MVFAACISALPLTVAVCDLVWKLQLQSLKLGLLQLFFHEATLFLILEQFWRTQSYQIGSNQNSHADVSFWLWESQVVVIWFGGAKM